jgi:uncharacterized protein
MQLRIRVLPQRCAVSRLAPDAPIPEWARGAFVSVTRTAAELSVVCDEAGVPADVAAQRGWRALEVEGPIPFETTGVAAAIASPLAEAKISVFMVATFDTDYMLVKAESLDDALAALKRAGIGIA